jgi:hypothetical protein
MDVFHRFVRVSGDVAVRLDHDVVVRDVHESGKGGGVVDCFNLLTQRPDIHMSKVLLYVPDATVHSVLGMALIKTSGQLRQFPLRVSARGASVRHSFLSLLATIVIEGCHVPLPSRNDNAPDKMVQH